jgi:hypothetical protein
VTLRLLTFSLLFIAVNISLGSVRQEPDVLAVRIAAREIRLPEDDAPSLRWVLDPFPTAGAVRVSDESFAPLLRQALQDLRDRKAAGFEKCKLFVLEMLEPDVSCDLRQALMNLLSAYKFDMSADNKYFFTPDGASPPEDARLTLTFTVPTLTIDSISVDLQTANAADPAFALPEASMTAGEAVITAHLSRKDLERSGGSRRPVEELQQELFRTGIKALEIAASAGLRIGRTISNDRRELTLIDAAILRELQPDRPRWSARVRTTILGGVCCRINVSELRFVDNVRIEAAPPQCPGEGGLVDVEAETDHGKQKLAEILKDAEDEANAELASHFRNLSGRIPTRTAISELLTEVQGLSRFTSDISPWSDGNDLVFTSRYSGVCSEIYGNVGIKGSLNPQEGVSGGAKVGGTDIFRLLFPRALGDVWEAAFDGGPEVQDLRASLSFPRERGLRHVLKYGVSMEGSFRRDGKQLLGGLSFFRNRPDAELKLIDRQTALVPKLYFEYGVAGAIRNELRLETFYELRGIRIRPIDSVLPPLIDGRLSAGNLSLRNFMSRDFAPAGEAPDGGGLGELLLGVEGLVKRGGSLFGGDFLFTRRDASATGRIFWGWRSRKDVFFRYKRGVGGGTVGTPIFLLQRIGGSGNVRGIEEGEYIGRYAAYDQWTAGISFAALWTTFGGGERGLGPLAEAYLTALHDRAALDDAGPITRPGGSFHGSGIGVELRNMGAFGRRVNLLIGYARSPQSALHRRGMMILDVNFGL